MKHMKSILYILALLILLGLSALAMLVPISELHYISVMAPYPYILDGECCTYIEFMGLEIRTIYYVALLVIYTIAQLVFVCFGIYKTFMKKYIWKDATCHDWWSQEFPRWQQRLPWEGKNITERTKIAQEFFLDFLGPLSDSPLGLQGPPHSLPLHSGIECARVVCDDIQKQRAVQEVRENSPPNIPCDSLGASWA